MARSGGCFWYFHVCAADENNRILPYVNRHYYLRDCANASVVPPLMDDRLLRDDPFGVEWVGQKKPMNDTGRHVYLPEEWPDFGPIMDLLGL